MTNTDLNVPYRLPLVLESSVRSSKAVGARDVTPFPPPHFGPLTMPHIFLLFH